MAANTELQRVTPVSGMYFRTEGGIPGACLFPPSPTFPWENRTSKQRQMLLPCTLGCSDTKDQVTRAPLSHTVLECVPVRLNPNQNVSGSKRWGLEALSLYHCIYKSREQTLPAHMRDAADISGKKIVQINTKTQA